MKKTSLSFIIVCSLIFCTPGIVITSSWKNPKLSSKNYGNLFIAALTSNTNARLKVENNVARALNNYGVQTVKSMDEIPPKFSNGKDSVSKEMIMSKVNGKNSDGILVCLIRKETESHYVPATYDDGFWGYYSYWYPFIYSPGYYAEDTVYFLDASLYDAKTEDLVWTAQSKSYNSTDLNTFSQKFGELIAKKLKTEGVIK